MPLDLRSVTHNPLKDFSAFAPAGAVIGIVGLTGSGKGTLLRLAAGALKPESGNVEAPAKRRLIQRDDAIDLSPVDLLALDSVLARLDPFELEQTCVGLEGLRRQRATILISTPDERVITRMADEVWWVNAGRLAGKGDARQILPKFKGFVADKLSNTPCLGGELDTRQRRGDGRAIIETLETLGPDLTPSLVLRNQAPGGIRIGIRYADSVASPVVGIMIRTRVGLEVYGTNSELEGLKLGPVSAGQVLSLLFRFNCSLCPGDYTVTIASHDPDGTAHDWLDDAAAFSVIADRYIAGVADLRASIVQI